MFNRSYHFIPADKPKLFDRIASLRADCIVFDLEDAVAADAKEAALRNLSDWLSNQTGSRSYYIRLNGFNTDWAFKEKALLAKFPWLSVVLPKLTSVEDLKESFDFYDLSGRSTIGLIEDATALFSMEKLLQANLLSGIGLGLEDFLSDSIYQAAQCTDLVITIRSKVALAAMSRGIEAIDTISLDFSEEAKALKLDCDNARSAGMTGKFSIHPCQIDTINECFKPQVDLISQAKLHQHWLEATSTASSGYFKKGNEIFSPPKIRKLKKVLDWLNSK